ncbi:Na(+)/H(+) antiporter subunit A [Desulfofustis limnaeus]|uniref:Na(+)/H(+) antiporter subunit A n=2 Tax=Desulfofustis limnaeus TaxID=2740163 RepID=A0ABN6M5D7_9BACT|nr:Na(+)/H(+) antiporter subunit A [Desulfofustis limnaeus]
MLATIVPAVLFILWCVCWPEIVKGRVLVADIPWMPSFDLSLRFRLDGLSLLFGLIVTGIGTLVCIYSAAYLSGHRHCGRYFFYLLAFMLSMLGLVTADNLLLLFLFWEATTIFSYLLISFDHESPTARENGRQSLLITAAGGLALLLGILLLKGAGYSYVISSWTDLSEPVSGHPLYPYILGAILLGAMTKSAQIPFHFWLPNAMSAPTPISAFLHAATMVKAGIYLLMRCHPLLGDSHLWTVSLATIGGITAVWGAAQAIGPRDLKRVLAYTTMMALGILTLFLAGRSTAALTAAVTFLLVHALYKAALFLAVGSIDHQAGSRNLNEISGLRRTMPLTALAVGAAALSMSGFPLFFGFIGKEIMYAGALAEELIPLLAASTALVANSLMTAVAAVLAIGPFTGPFKAIRQQVVEAPWTMWLGPLLLGGLGILFGLIPGWVSRALVEPAVNAFHPNGEEVRLALFHGFNLPLVLSMLTLSFGIGAYLLRDRLHRVLIAPLTGLPFGAEKGYYGSLNRFMKGSGTLTEALQNGSLHFYLAVIIGALIVAVGWPLTGGVLGWVDFSSPLPDPAVLALLVFIAAAALVVVTARKRLAAIGGLGGIGGGVALLFLSYGAPDIALTQLMVETLTIIFVSLAMLRLPAIERSRLRPPRRRLGDGLLSLAAGTLLALLLMGIGRVSLDRSLTAFFEANSYLAAHGRNIVNVILVDFRSFDTLGEIIVVVLAAWAAVTLIRKPMEP